MRFSYLALALLLVACDSDGGGTDAGVDAGMDSGTADGDAGMEDAGPGDSDAGPGDTDAGPGDMDAGDMDSGMADAGAPDAGAPDAGAPDAGAPDAGAPDAGRPDAGRRDAGPPMRDAGPGGGGCVDNAGCAASEFCEKAVGNCGGMGTCMPRPFICSLIFDPQCGCDNMTYSNTCRAHAAGVSVGAMGACP